MVVTFAKKIVDTSSHWAYSPPVPDQETRFFDQYPGRYNHKRLVVLMETGGFTPRTAADKAGLSKTTIAEALVGECKKLETLWIINSALGGKWEDLFKLNNSNSHRAVRSESSRGAVKKGG